MCESCETIYYTLGTKSRGGGLFEKQASLHTTTTLVRVPRTTHLYATFHFSVLPTSRLVTEHRNSVISLKLAFVFPVSLKCVRIYRYIKHEPHFFTQVSSHMFVNRVNILRRTQIIWLLTGTPWLTQFLVTRIQILCNFKRSKKNLK